jgi:hypothetical protein
MRAVTTPAGFGRRQGRVETPLIGATTGRRYGVAAMSAAEAHAGPRSAARDALAVLALVALVAAARPLTTGVGAPHPHEVMCSTRRSRESRRTAPRRRPSMTGA